MPFRCDLQRKILKVVALPDHSQPLRHLTSQIRYAHNQTAARAATCHES